MMGQRTVSRGVSALGTSSSSEATTGAHTYANPPIKTLQHAQHARGAKVTEGRRLTSLHDLRGHEQGNVNANWLVV